MGVVNQLAREPDPVRCRDFASDRGVGYNGIFQLSAVSERPEVMHFNGQMVPSS